MYGLLLNYLCGFLFTIRLLSTFKRNGLEQLLSWDFALLLTADDYVIMCELKGCRNYTAFYDRHFTFTDVVFRLELAYS
jgi:hypothetical protein